MKITLNGKIKEVVKNQTLKDLLQVTYREPKGIIVMRNDQIMNDKQQVETQIEENDKIDFLQIIGGG